MTRATTYVAPDIARGIRRCNSGGPMSRTRRQPIHSSLLGRRNDGIPLVLEAALDFEDYDPLAAVLEILERAGLDEPEQLKQRYPAPPEPCICREFRAAKPLKIRSASDDEILQQVLCLGLSTRYYYDPCRPVLLTRSSLTRHLQYFCGEGFYA